MLDGNLSKYRIIRPLGSGGMGVVYLAHDTTLGRDVAIKCVSPDRLHEPDAQRRLVREAQAAAVLDHPCICPVYDVVVDDEGQTTIVMQYVEGETLADRLRRGPLDPRQALSLAADIAEALAVAHAHGIVHRDLKPQNVMLTPSGRPKLLDFGIAKVRPFDSARAETHTSSTALGVVVGSPGYMSPEQVMQRPFDGRSDLFSLGAVLFECLTGQQPFQTGTPIESAARVLHVDPPPVSTLVPELSAQHDELCQRLLAKDPADRFQSAEEVLGALRLLLPARTTTGATVVSDAPLRWRRTAAVAAAVLLVVVAGWLFFARLSRSAVPAAPPEAQRWYEIGTEHIRNGAYHSAQQALKEAIRLFPDYPQAYARLAEAQSELDEEGDAQKALLQASALVPDPSRLPGDDGLRVAAIRALVLRDVPEAIRAYQRIAENQPHEAGAWLDVARAREAADLRAEARDDYARALRIDQQYAAAHLRLGRLEAFEARRDEALKSFDEAERLYRAASDREGETEALLARAQLYNGVGELGAARNTLDRAIKLAAETNRFQQIRAALLLASITASEGKFAEAERVAAEAVQRALENSLHTVAADGLIELGTALLRSSKPKEAEAQLNKAIDMAVDRGAQRVAARGKLQLAGLFLARSQPRDALNIAQGLLEFLRSQRYRRYELVALSIMARAHEDLGEYPRALNLAQHVLQVSEELKDDSEVALALDTLAGLAAATGRLPEGLAAIERLEAAHRRNNDLSALAFDLTRRAELLIQLGRAEAADAPLREVEDGISRKVDAFMSRERRVKLLRALQDTTRGRFDRVPPLCTDIIEASTGGRRNDSTMRYAVVLLAHARARLGQPARNAGELAALDAKQSPLSRHELQYWRAATWVASGDHRQALDEVSKGLGDLASAPSDENEWRIAAMGAVAARRLGDDQRARELSGRAQAALDRLRAAWGPDIADYERRPDFTELRREAGLGQP